MYSIYNYVKPGKGSKLQVYSLTHCMIALFYRIVISYLLDLSVGFTRELTRVSEGVGSFELCVSIFIPELNPSRGPFQLANPFSLQLMSVNGTAGEYMGGGNREKTPPCEG